MADKKVILLVEDDAEVRDAIANILRSAGFAAVPAANGLYALEHVAIFGAPALVIVDLTMPVMDGRQFLAERRKWASLTHVPFVVLTANATATAAELAVAEVLRKPVDAEQLLAVARRYATGRSGTYTAVTPEAPRAKQKSEH
jgi:CheY-like chemotaxis protein